MKAYYLPLLLIATCSNSFAKCAKKPAAKSSKPCCQKLTTAAAQPKKVAIPNAEVKPTVAGEKPSAKPEATTVTITNNVDCKKDTTYKWGFISYTPNKFVFKVNGKEVEPGKEVSIPTADTFLVRYDYEFANGKRKGAKEIEFKRNPNAQKLDMRFSWNNQWRVSFKDDAATPVKVTQVES